MSTPIIYCDPIVTKVPICVEQMYFETDRLSTNIQIRIEKYNGRVRYDVVPVDTFGVGTYLMNADPFFSPYAGRFKMTATDLSNLPVFFVSNQGFHPAIYFDVEYATGLSTAHYYLDQNIVYFCCEATLNKCGICPPGQTLNLR